MNQQNPFVTPPRGVALTVGDVELLDRQGAFDAYGKVELLDGELLYVNAQYRRNMVAKGEMAYRLRRVLEQADIALFVGTEGSVALSDHDLPQPDILLTSAPDGDGPVPGDSIALLVEVADTTLAFDMGRKSRVYATALVPEYWVVDLNGGTVHQMWAPVDGIFGEHRQVALGEVLVSATIANVTIATDII